MRRHWLAALLALTSIGAAPAASALEIGAAAPTLAAPDAQGRSQPLQQYRGRWVYVDFWASWCAPCREAMPALDQLHQRYRDQGLVVLGVNVDSDRAAAQRMLDRFAPGFPVVFDPQGHWPTAFGLQAMPSAYLIDPEGVVRWIKTGYHSRDLPLLDAEIKKALGSAR